MWLHHLIPKLFYCFGVGLYGLMSYCQWLGCHYDGLQNLNHWIWFHLFFLVAYQALKIKEWGSTSQVASWAYPPMTQKLKLQVIGSAWLRFLPVQDRSHSYPCGIGASLTGSLCLDNAQDTLKVDMYVV